METICPPFIAPSVCEEVVVGGVVVEGAMDQRRFRVPQNSVSISPCLFHIPLVELYCEGGSSSSKCLKVSYFRARKTFAISLVSVSTKPKSLESHVSIVWQYLCEAYELHPKPLLTSPLS